MKFGSGRRSIEGLKDPPEKERNSLTSCLSLSTREGFEEEVDRAEVVQVSGSFEDEIHDEEDVLTREGGSGLEEGGEAREEVGEVLNGLKEFGSSGGGRE